MSPLAYTPESCRGQSSSFPRSMEAVPRWMEGDGFSRVAAARLKGSRSIQSEPLVRVKSDARETSPRRADVRRRCPATPAQRRGDPPVAQGLRSREQERHLRRWRAGVEGGSIEEWGRNPDRFRRPPVQDDDAGGRDGDVERDQKEPKFDVHGLSPVAQFRTTVISDDEGSRAGTPMTNRWPSGETSYGVDRARPRETLRVPSKNSRTGVPALSVAPGSIGTAMIAPSFADR